MVLCGCLTGRAKGKSDLNVVIGSREGEFGVL